MNKEKELEKLRAFLEGKKKGKGVSEIIDALGWSKKHKKENRKILDEWVEAGLLGRVKGDRYCLLEEGGYLQGSLEIIKNKFAFVDGPEFSVFVPRSKFNTATHGDEVLVKITEDKDGKKKEGEVVKVVKRGSNRVIGIFERSKNFGFVVPTHSFGKDIYIPNKFCVDVPNKKLVVVEVDFWGDAERKPEGRIIDILGDPFDTNVMIEALIERDGLSEEFNMEVKREVKDLREMTEEEIKEKRDLRHLPIVTIDGDDAKDLDDAVYVEKFPNGNYKLLVSIADVSHYVKSGSALDKEAYLRGNSVYLVDRVIPMFPRELSNGLCSLNPNENKATFTCEMIFDENGKLIDHDVYKSVIKTAERMTYTNVNKVLAGDAEMTERYANVKDMFFTMLELSKILRGIKRKRGSIDFDLPEIKVILDENKKVKYLKNRERGESERIIEDFMIAANECVAEKLFWLELPSIYRTHEKPDAERIKTLNESLEKFDFRIHNYDDLHPGVFQKIIDDSKEKGLNMIIHKLILMSLKQAKYTKENFGHFGLSSNYYTHFTSPIRRYADLVVHRILAETLKGYPNSKFVKYYENNLDEIGGHISKTERTAMKLEEESVKIKVVEFMMDKIGEEYKARVTGMSINWIFFETEDYIECQFDVIAAKGYYEKDDTTLTMTERDTGKTYHIGDELRVMVTRADLRELLVEVVPVEDN